MYLKLNLFRRNLALINIFFRDFGTKKLEYIPYTWFGLLGISFHIYESLLYYIHSSGTILCPLSLVTSCVLRHFALLFYMLLSKQIMGHL